MSNKRILCLLTRTPLHVGAGASIGAIDQPIVRERHTGFPIIPASSLKGTFSDEWNERNGSGKLKRSDDGNWLFGVGADTDAAAGAIQLSEARLLAFPIRSAKGSFAWITSPLLLQRAVRDGVLEKGVLDRLKEPKDDEAVFDAGPDGKLSIGGKIVLEEYTFKAVPWLGLTQLSEAVATLVDDDPVWNELKDRLVILSNGMMSFFAQNACEIAQHVRIDDETGTAAGSALFNQENVPGETFFYSVVHAFEERTANSSRDTRRSAEAALNAFGDKVAQKQVFQFGGDASTGHGYCTVKINA